MSTLDNAAVDSSTAEASPPLTSPIFPFSFWERFEAEVAAPPEVVCSVAGPVDLCSLTDDGWEIAEGTGGTMDKTALDNGATEANQTVELSPWPTQPSYLVKMDLPVNLVDAVRLVSTTGTHWIQLYFAKPVLITRVILNLTNATISNYDVQIQECDRWKNLPSGDEVYEKFGTTVARDFAMALMKPIEVLRIVLYDATVDGLDKSFASISAVGFKSNVEGMPIVLATPKLLPLQSETVRLSASDSGSANNGIENILTDGMNMEKDCWQVLHYPGTGCLWIKMDFLQPAVNLITRAVLEWAGNSPDCFELQVPVASHGYGDAWQRIYRYPENSVHIERLGQFPGSKRAPLQTIHTFQVPATYLPAHSLRILIHSHEKEERSVALWRVRLYGYQVDDPETKAV